MLRGDSNISRARSPNHARAMLEMNQSEIAALKWSSGELTTAYKIYKLTSRRKRKLFVEKGKGVVPELDHRILLSSTQFGTPSVPNLSDIGKHTFAKCYQIHIKKKNKSYFPTVSTYKFEKG